MDQDTLTDLAGMFDWFAAGAMRRAADSLPRSDRDKHMAVSRAWADAAAWCRDAAAGTTIEVDTRPAVPAGA
jgi:hypothetical protein